MLLPKKCFFVVNYLYLLISHKGHGWDLYLFTQGIRS